MKILWLAPYPLNNLAENIPGYYDTKKGKGMWLPNLLQPLSMVEEINIHVVTYTTKIKKSISFSNKNVTFHILKNQIPIIKKGFPYYFPLHKALQYPFLVKKMGKVIVNINPDIIHIHGTENAYILAPMKLKIPVLVSIQGIISEIFNNKKSLSNYFQKKIELKGIKTFSHFGCRTQFDSAFVRSINTTATIHYLPEAINNLYFQFIHEIKGREEISFVGNVSKAKGIEIILHAVKHVKLNFPEIILNIIGSSKGKYLRTIIELIKYLGIEKNVLFHGFQSPEQIIRLHLKSTIYVLPTFMDNSPNSLCEAMALGMPCIASKVGGIPDLIKDAENGLLFETGNILELSEKINFLLTNKNYAKKLGNNARKTAFERNYPTKVANVTIGVYNNIIKAI